MKLSLACLSMLVLAVLAGAQESVPMPALEDSQAPAALAGQHFSLRPLGEREIPNLLTGGVAISQMYTDNAELATTNPISDLSYDIQPHLAISSSSSRLTYNAGVLAGFLVNGKLNERNQANQNVNLDVSYRLAQFVTLRVSDRFTNSMGLWSGSAAGLSDSAGGIGTLQTPNASLLTYGRFRTNVALADLSTQLNAASYAGVRGTYSYLWFPSGASDPTLGTFYGGNTYSAEAYYNHRFSVRHWGGIALRTQRFDINGPGGRTDAASLIFLYAVNLRSNTTLTFFGGPELSVSDQPRILAPLPTFQRRLWSPVTGAEFTWRGQRTSASASFSREISNSGGLVSAVTLSSAQGQILRQLTRRF